MNFLSLPAIYDTAFQFRDTAKTVDFLEDCVEMYTDIGVESVVEFACGSGCFTTEFARRGYRTYGVDIDEAMCQYAMRRAWSERLDVTIFQADMVDATLPRRCDLALNLFDSLTYVTDEREIIRHLQTVADALTPGGLYILEVGVIDDIRNHQSDDIWTETRGDCSVTTCYRRHEAIDIERRTFLEECQFRVACRNEYSVVVLKQAKFALMFHEFLRMVERSERFIPIVFFDEFAPDAFLPKDAVP